tara:strand:+ start:1155 stop:1871 length:717 start_codon:yes stop_codon:yes gene_type:complete
MMKVFTLYYDRFETATTSLALKNSKIEHTVICHYNKEKFKNICGDIIETNKAKGIQYNLNAGLELLEEGEWGVFLSDDYKKSFRLDKKDNKFVECELEEVFENLVEATKVADTVGVKLVGLNSTGNALYASKKYGKYGLVDGRMFAIKKTEFEWRKDINTITDYYASLYHMKKYGGNLILQDCYAEFDRYASDGIGTAQNRAEDKKKDIRILKNLFRNMVKVKEKAGQPKGTHIIIKR